MCLCVLTQSEGAVVGFVTVSGQMDLKLLNQCFELGAFEGLRKTSSAHQEEPPEESQPLGEDKHVTDAQESSEAKEPVQVSFKRHVQLSMFNGTH